MSLLEGRLFRDDKVRIVDEILVRPVGKLSHPAGALHSVCSGRIWIWADLHQRNDANNFKLVVAIRAKSAVPFEAGPYPMAFGFFPFDSISPQAATKTAEIANANCVEFVLFRIPTAQAEQSRFKLPFNPGDYGNGVKLLSSAYDGKGCP